MRAHMAAICVLWYEQVVWATPEDPMKREEFTDQELQQSGYLTMRFTEETWFNPAIRHLQRVTSAPSLAPLLAASVHFTHLFIPHRAKLPPANINRLPITAERQLGSHCRTQCKVCSAVLSTTQPISVQAGWDESKVDVTERDFDCMTWQALRMPSIAKKAAVHAHAMNAALLGKYFVIPPAPGVSSDVSALARDYQCVCCWALVSPKPL